MPDQPLIVSTAQTAESTLVWVIQVLRGSWFRRLILVLVLVAVGGNRTTLFQLGVPLPEWYLAVYLVVIALLLIVTLVVGAKTIPRYHVKPAQAASRAIRGLLPFNIEDADLFASLERNVELQRVSAVVSDPNFRFGVLLGPSGSGKTSFLRAGLFPHLQARYSHVRYVELTSEDPCRTIAFARTPAAGATDDEVLLIDQFEQFYLHQHTAAQRAPFIAQLQEWTARSTRVRVFISIRDEDSWQILDIQRHLRAHLSNQNCFRLENFTPDQAVDVLRVLCDRAGIMFDRHFVQSVVQDDLVDKDGAVSPANIGIMLLIIATRRQQFTPQGFKAHGGMESLLDAWLTSQLQAARLQGFETAAIKVLSALCDFDTDRRAAIQTIRTLSRHVRDASELRRVIDWLASPDVRLIIRASNTDHEGIQLAHERLIAAIRKAAGRTATAGAKASALLDRRVGEWLNNDRAPRFLLPLREYVQIRRQALYLVWNPNRAAKEGFLTRSRARLWRRAWLALGLLVVPAGMYFGWQTNAVQRHYLLNELYRVGQGHPSEDAARSLASAGRLQQAIAVADRIEYFDEADRSIIRGQLAVEAAKAGVRTQTPSRVDDALRLVSSLDPESRTDALISIGSILLAEAVATHNAAFRHRAEAVLELLEDTDRTEVQAQLSSGLAEAGLVDEAIREIAKLDVSMRKDPLEAITGSDDVVSLVAASMSRRESFARLVGSLSGSDRRDVVDGLAVINAMAGRCNAVDILIAEVPEENRDTTADLIGIRLATMAVRRRDESLLTCVETLATRLSLEERVWREIAVAAAVLGKALNRPHWQARARLLARTIQPNTDFIALWKIAVALKDHQRAREVFDLAVRHYQDDDPDKLAGMPAEMFAFALIVDDVTVQRQATRDVALLPVSLRAGELQAIAEHLLNAGQPRYAHKILEQAMKETKHLPPASSKYSTVTASIAADMARLGKLEAAAEIAEAALQPAIKAEILTAVVLADASQREFKPWARASEHYFVGAIERD